MLSPRSLAPGRTVGGPARIRMLTTLMDGRAATAKALACRAGVDPATATFHLRRLTADGFLESTSSVPSAATRGRRAPDTGIGLASC